MGRRCVAYLRVSTPSQSVGHGLIRQLEACVDYARKNGLYLVGVYGDSCSGDGSMPNRQIAYLTANQLGCPILVESRDRWSRMAYGTDPLRDAPIILTSPTAREFEDRCEQLVRDAITQEVRRITQ